MNSRPKAGSGSMQKVLKASAPTCRIYRYLHRNSRRSRIPKGSGKGKSRFGTEIALFKGSIRKGMVRNSAFGKGRPPVDDRHLRAAGTQRSGKRRLAGYQAGAIFGQMQQFYRRFRSMAVQQKACRTIAAGKTGRVRHGGAQGGQTFFERNKNRPLVWPCQQQTDSASRQACRRPGISGVRVPGGH